MYGCKTHQINSPSSLILTHLFFIPLLLHPTSPSSNSSSSIFLIHLFLMDLPLCRRARQSPKEFSSLVFSLRPPSVSTTRPCPSCLCQFVPRALPTVVYILTAAWTSERLSTAATPFQSLASQPQARYHHQSNSSTRSEESAESTPHTFKDPQSCPASHSTHHTTSTLSSMHIRGIGVLEGCNEGTLKGRDGPPVIPDSDAEVVHG